MSAENSKNGILDSIRHKIYYGLTYKGLITFTIVYEFCLILFLSTFSKPITQLFGGPLLPIVLENTREAQVARVIVLYHSLAIPFLAAVVYYILDVCDVRENWAAPVKWFIFPGSMLTSVSGITFAYILPHNWIAHGLFLMGNSLVFFSGILLLIGVFPTKSFPVREDPNEGPYVGGINIAQVNLTLVTFALLISAMLGAIAGAYFGQDPGFEAFLAEDIVRLKPHSFFELLIISHLHIMVALLDVAVFLLVFRYTFPKQQGNWYKRSMMLTIPGILITTGGDWLVITGWDNAHMVINVGAMFLLLAALILMVLGWNKISKNTLGPSYNEASWLVRAKAVLKDPVKAGMYFQFLWVNFVVTLPGIYLAINLESVRELPFEVEKAITTGHWHILATLTAVIMLMLSVDYLGIQGKVRQLAGWLITVGSILAFGFTVVYMFKDQVRWTYYFFDLGLILIVIAIVFFCVHELIELLKGKKDVTDYAE